MRELNAEERASLAALDTNLPTADLIQMADGLVDILRGRGHLIQARLVEVMIGRLEDLDGQVND